MREFPEINLMPEQRMLKYFEEESQFQVIENPDDATQFAVRGGIWNIINSGQTHYADAATTAADITGSIFGMDTLTDNGGAGKLPADLYTDASMSLISSTTYYVFLIANSSTQYGGFSNYDTYSIFYSVYRPPLDSPDFDDYNPESIKVLAKVDTDADGVLTITQEWRGGNPKTNVDVLDSVDDLTDDDSDWDMQTLGYNDRGCKEIYGAKATLADTQQNQDKKALYFDVDENAGVAGEVTTRCAWPVTADLSGSPRPYNDYDDPATFANPQVASITDAGASGSYAYMTVNSRTFTVSDATLDIGALDGGTMVNIPIGNVNSTDITWDGNYFAHTDLSWTPNTSADVTGLNGDHNYAYLRRYDTAFDATYENNAEYRNKAQIYSGTLGIADTGTGAPDATNVWSVGGFKYLMTNGAKLVADTHNTFEAGKVIIEANVQGSSAGGALEVLYGGAYINDSIFVENDVNSQPAGTFKDSSGGSVIETNLAAIGYAAKMQDGNSTVYICEGTNALYADDGTHVLSVLDGTDVFDVDGTKYSPMTVDVVIGGITKTINILGSLV